MKKRNLKYLSTVEYLEHVLANWETWRVTNGGLARAIEDILKTYKQMEMLNGYLLAELEKEKATPKGD